MLTIVQTREEPVPTREGRLTHALVAVGDCSGAGSGDCSGECAVLHPPPQLLSLVLQHLSHPSICTCGRSADMHACRFGRAAVAHVATLASVPMHCKPCAPTAEAEVPAVDSPGSIAATRYTCLSLRPQVTHGGCVHGWHARSSHDTARPRCVMCAVCCVLCDACCGVLLVALVAAAW